VRTALIAHFGAHRADLSEDSLTRLAKNPMRILDSKDPRDRPAADSAPDIDEFLTDEARSFFEQVTAGLDAAGVAWTRNARLVRGLDYYRHTAFEFVTDRLGAQGTVLAGGRYDGLIEALGGPHTPAIGWAAGIERLAMMIEAPKPERPRLAVIADKPAQEQEAVAITAALRRGQLAVELPIGGNSKKRAERAKKAGVDALLYVREAPTMRDRLHLTNVTLTSDGAMDLLMEVLGRLPEPYRQLSGDDEA
jgi:histidyl-tRNA synthetase